MNGSRFVPALLPLAFAFLFSTQVFAQDRDELLKKIESLKNELSLSEKEFLEPSKEDKAAYADLLSQPNAGLIRLMPRGKYEGKLTIRGAGAYFSFSRLTHEYGYGSDIELQQGKFMVGFAGADFGFLTNLGDVPIESVNQEHPALDFLFNFTTPLEEPKAREEHRKSGTGFQVKEHSYISHLDAKINTTYALRSIGYGTSDVLVVFRAIRQDSDGSMILAWRLLKTFQKPELIRP